MDELVSAYIDYILNLKEVLKPPMPEFDVSAYTDIEYANAIFGSLANFDLVDDTYLTIEFLKGEEWK